MTAPFISEPVPDWISLSQSVNTDAAQKPDTPLIRAQIEANRQALQELEQQTFTIAFEMALEAIAGGTPLSEFCLNYHTTLPAAKFRTWIYRNLKRKQAYLAAKAIGAETVEDDMIRISDGVRADGTQSPEDVSRSTLRVNTRKWLLQVWNRPRYGEKTTIEQTTTTRVDTSGMSTDEIRARLLEAMGVDASSGGEGGGVIEDAIDG